MSYVGYACVGATLALGTGVVLLQMRTLQDVCAKNAAWPRIEAACRAHAHYIKALCRRGEALQAFLRASEAGAYGDNIVVLVFDEKLQLTSDGIGDARGADESLRAISLAMQGAPKMEAPRRVHVSIARDDGAVKQHEMCVRWVQCAQSYVVALQLARKQ